jgi:hypothetical protein
MGCSLTADGKKGPIELLEEASHLPPGTAKLLFEEAKRNYAVLDACPGPHAFVAHERYGGAPDSPIRTYRCSRCGGILGASEVRWYDYGVEHGKRVLPIKEPR